MKFVNLLPAFIQAIFSIGVLLMVSRSRFNIKKTAIITCIFMFLLCFVNTIFFYNSGLNLFEKYNLFTVFLPQAIFVSCISKRRPMSSIIASLTAYLAIYAVQLTKNVFTVKFESKIFDYLHIIAFPFIFFYLRKIYVQLHNEIEQVLPKLLYLILVFELILYTEFFVYGALINATTKPVLRLEIFIVATTSIYFVAIAILYFMINQYKKYMINESDSHVLRQAVDNLEEII